MAPDPRASQTSAPPSQSPQSGAAAPDNPGFEIVDFRRLPAVDCPCGQSQRALAHVPDFPATLHVTHIQEDAQLHYHKRLTEVYYFLECDSDAQMQLNDQLMAVHPGMCVLIRPGTRHRAVGKMKVLIVVSPKFDATDEWFD